MKLTPEQEALADKLTNLQRLTVLGIVAGMTQVEAYRAAGGKTKTDESARAIVSRMLTDANVKAFYDSLIAVAANNAILTRQQALERLTLMATTEITDILEFRTIEVKKVGKDGEEETDEETIWLMKDSPEIQRRARAAIKSVTLTKQGPKIELYDAKDAMAQIAKMEGWEAAQKIDHTTGGEPFLPTRIEIVSPNDNSKS